MPKRKKILPPVSPNHMQFNTSEESKIESSGQTVYQQKVKKIFALSTEIHQYILSNCLSCGETPDIYSAHNKLTKDLLDDIELQLIASINTKTSVSAKKTKAHHSQQEQRTTSKLLEAITTQFLVKRLLHTEKYTGIVKFLHEKSNLLSREDFKELGFIAAKYNNISLAQYLKSAQLLYVLDKSQDGCLPIEHTLNFNQNKKVILKKTTDPAILLYQFTINLAR